MDYKKKYEEALERARKLATDLPDGINDRLYYIDDLEKIFPELAESREEKIRKDIIAYLEGKRISAGHCLLDDWIAWLEKQGEPLNESVFDTEDKEIYQAISIGLTDVFNEFGWIVFGGMPIENIQNWLERQGEQKPINNDLEDAKKEFNNILRNKVSFETLKTLLETWWQNTLTIINMKPVEQKPFEENRQEGDKIVTNSDGSSFNISQLERVSKPEDVNGEKIRKALITYFKDIEENGYSNWVILNPHEVITYLESKAPCVNEIDEQIARAASEMSILDLVDDKQGNPRKFKPGDFIVNDYCSGKVVAITDDAYLLDTGQGIPFSYEHNARLWTIQDAKRGDVLVADDALNEYIYIFKEIAEGGVVFGYCDYSEEFCIDEQDVCYSNLVHRPATKEERDLLFSKMREAGYEWDAEKKNVRTIQNKRRE